MGFSSQLLGTTILVVIIVGVTTKQDVGHGRPELTVAMQVPDGFNTEGGRLVRKSFYPLYKKTEIEKVFLTDPDRSKEDLNEKELKDLAYRVANFIDPFTSEEAYMSQDTQPKDLTDFSQPRAKTQNAAGSLALLVEYVKKLTYLENRFDNQIVQAISTGQIYETVNMLNVQLQKDYRSINFEIEQLTLEILNNTKAKMAKSQFYSKLAYFQEKRDATFATYRSHITGATPEIKEANKEAPELNQKLKDFRTYHLATFLKNVITLEHMLELQMTKRGVKLENEIYAGKYFPFDTNILDELREKYDELHEVRKASWVYEEMTEEEKEKATSLQDKRDVLEHLVEEYARDFKKELLNLFPSLGGRVIKLQKKLFELDIKNHQNMEWIYKAKREEDLYRKFDAEYLEACGLAEKAWIFHPTTPNGEEDEEDESQDTHDEL